ncbi:hypothetical protein AAY473_028777 [Plecturocebus cupreus]
MDGVVLEGGAMVTYRLYIPCFDKCQYFKRARCLHWTLERTPWDTFVTQSMLPETDTFYCYQFKCTSYKTFSHNIFSWRLPGLLISSNKHKTDLSSQRLQCEKKKKWTMHSIKANSGLMRKYMREKHNSESKRYTELSH